MRITEDSFPLDESCLLFQDPEVSLNFCKCMFPHCKLGTWYGSEGVLFCSQIMSGIPRHYFCDELSSHMHCLLSQNNMETGGSRKTRSNKRNPYLLQDMAHYQCCHTCCVTFDCLDMPIMPIAQARKIDINS